MTLIGEFKKGETAEARNDVRCLHLPCCLSSMSTVSQNVCKLLWGMKMAMNEDFRRRFVFGFTIENTTTRLWFSDRSQVVVSDPFDFTKVRPTSLIQRCEVTQPPLTGTQAACATPLCLLIFGADCARLGPYSDNSRRQLRNTPKFRCARG